MRWSKLKTLVEDRLAPELKGRIAFNSARYGNCTCGRFWVSVDGEELANLCTRAYYNTKFHERDEPSQDSLKRFAKTPVNYGEFSRQQAYEAIWEFVHDLPIEDALTSRNPLHQMLAVVDSRLGKRRLRAIDVNSLHPLVRTLLEIRLKDGQRGLHLSLLIGPRHAHVGGLQVNALACVTSGCPLG